MCYRAHWKEHKAEHKRLFKLLSNPGKQKEEVPDQEKTTDENKSTKKQKPNSRCNCGSKKKLKNVVALKKDERHTMQINRL